MNREIKFRARRKLNNDWVYGSYVYQGNDFCRIISLDTEWDWDDLGEKSFCVITDTVGQYTGLKDKHGKEIYEGDIVKNDNGQKYVIVWIEQIAGWYFSIPNTYRGKEPISCAASKIGNDPMLLFKEEIIGNVYENPELL